MSDPVELIFRIKGGYTPSTIPMQRLAEYMADFAKMLGDPEKVHFVKLVERSVGVVAKVEPDTYPVVEERVDQIRRGVAPVVNMDAYRSLNRRLKEDGHHAELLSADHSAAVLDFPGALAPVEKPISGITQASSLDGVVIWVGGKAKDKTVSVQSGSTVYRCTATKQVAKELAQYLFESEVRVHGQGKWSRTEDGVWQLNKFAISYFEPLERRPLSEVVAVLRAMHRANPDASADPWGDLREMRDGGDDD